MRRVPTNGESRLHALSTNNNISFTLKKSISLILAVGILNAAQIFAQNPPEPAPADIETLRRQVEALTKTVGALQQQVDKQKQRWDGFHAPASAVLDGRAVVISETTTSTSSGALDQIQRDVDELKSAQRQEKGGLFNPDISAAVDFITSYSRATNNLNFTLRDAEVMIQSNIDQYARAYMVLNAESELMPTEKTDPFGEVSVGVEEAAIETTSLPWGLQVKGGQFFADFTRLGKVHSHDLPFVDRPRSLDALLGGETKARGFELNWKPPIDQYVRLTGGLVDNIGAETPVTNNLLLLDGSDSTLFIDRDNRTLTSLLGYARAATLVDLGPGTLLRLGADYAQSAQGAQRRIASTDATVEWRPDPASFDLFEAGGELLWNRQNGRLVEDAVFSNAWGSATGSGGYVYAQYRFGKTWQPGVRVDRTRARDYQLVDCNDDGDADYLDSVRANTWTYSTYLTVNLSEFNRLRLQLNYVDSDAEIAPGKGHNDLQAFFQWTVILGAHKHSFVP